MKKILIPLLVGMAALLGCITPAAPAVPAVTLGSPANGSTVSSLSPILTWTASTSGASYRVQVANDNNFQNLVIDAANLAGVSYNIPSGKLSKTQTYYWKVSASKDNQTSVWSPYWSFQTPAAEPVPPPEPDTSTIKVSATLDGESWQGDVVYNLGGPQMHSGSQAPQQFSNLPVDTYTMAYGSGGPAGATLASITPQLTQTTVAGGITTFTLNFASKLTCGIRVRATLDGKSWTGSVNYTITGPQTLSGSSVMGSFSGLPVGNYTVGYNSGGPAGATLASITPQPTQTTIAGSTTTFYLNFYSEATSAIRVKATLDGKSWTGKVYYDIDGPQGLSGSSVSKSFSNLPIGTYTTIYNHGGPSGATLVSITLQPTQTTVANKTTTFTFNFISGANSTVQIKATLDGETWNGSVRYDGTGPRGNSADLYSVPDKYSNLPAGTYSISYISGGPAGATLSSIAPSALQTVSAGRTITFTMRFHSVANGNIVVNATADGAPWQGSIDYSIIGPYTDSGTSVPYTFGGVPEGSYTIVYWSGGPEGCVLDRISPSATQYLSSDGTIIFNLDFVCLEPLPGPEPY